MKVKCPLTPRRPIQGYECPKEGWEPLEACKALCITWELLNQKDIDDSNIPSVVLYELIGRLTNGEAVLMARLSPVDELKEVAAPGAYAGLNLGQSVIGNWVSGTAITRDGTLLYDLRIFPAEDPASADGSTTRSQTPSRAAVRTSSRAEVRRAANALMKENMKRDDFLAALKLKTGCTKKMARDLWSELASPEMKQPGRPRGA